MKTTSSLTIACTLLVLMAGLLLAACDSAPVTDEIPPSVDPPPEETLPPNPPPPTDDGGDLQIRYIQRLPEIDFVWGSTNPSVEGWPALGQEAILSG